MHHARTTPHRARRTAAAVLAGIALLTPLAVRADAAPNPGSTVTAAAEVEPFWADEFDGRRGTRPDADTWRTEVGNRRQQGWWNNELQYYTADPANSARNGSGALHLTARRAGPRTDLPCWPRGRCRFTSARLTTEGAVALRYGRVDVRAKLPTGRGLLPAIWMLGDNGRVWPRQGELDVVEVVGHEPRTAYGTAHGPTYFNEDGLGGSVDLGARADRGFHVYSLVKEPRRITWLVDGEPYFRLTPADLPSRRDWVFEQDMHLLLNVAVGGDWPGRPGARTRFPATMAVDYVRMWGEGTLDGAAVSSGRP